jgi:protein phosphatase
MKYAFCALTDTGRARANNEDSVVFDEVTQLGVLADGMGGYNAGEVASGMATAFIKSELSRWLSSATPRAKTSDIKRVIELCVANANRSILNAAATNPQYAGMGTTLVLGVFQGNRLIVGHMGDSRCYRWRGTELLQITKDHSFLQEQIDAGVLTPAQAATAPNKNIVTRALGVEAGCLLELNEHRVEAGDIYLMCSDGLSDMLPDTAIAKILQNEPMLTQRAAGLVALANQNGGRDNITVLLIKATAKFGKRGFITKLLGK